MAARDESTILIEPLFGYSKDSDKPYRPTTREILAEWIDCVNFVKHPSRTFIALNFAFHLSTFVIAIVFLLNFASLTNLLFVVVAACFLGTLYNTVWYHRYCSHASFQLKKVLYARIFLWLNPIFFREEYYAIPHLIHHQKAERAGDPYGPHLGWLGSYLAVESSQKLNTNMSEKAYESLVRSLSHIGFPINSYLAFRRTGGIETTGYYLGRVFFAQLWWCIFFFTLAGVDLVLGWYTAIFVQTFLVREFNWRGHGGNYRFEKKPGWEFDRKSRALNQRFYGFTVAEWHDNHHRYPMSANNGFLTGQIDLAFQFIKLLSLVGIVKSYFDAKRLFLRDIHSHK